MKRPDVAKLPRTIIDYIEHLESELKPFKESTLVDSYLTLYFQVKDLNKQLQIGDEEVEKTIGIDKDGISVKERVLPGKLDLFSHKDDKSIDRAFKFWDKVDEYEAKLTKMLKDMTPEQRELVNTKKMMADASVAEQLATEKRNGKH